MRPRKSDKTAPAGSGGGAPGKRGLAGTGLSVGATLSFRRGGEAFLGGDRIGLLEAIDRHGSITRAARAVGVSYKTAWDAVDAMNNVAGSPLVSRSVGGRGGGGARLTDDGKDAVRMYRVLQREQRRLVAGLEGRLGDVERLYSLLGRVAMRVSARNVFHGKVKRLRKGAVSTEVTLALKGGERLCSVITNESAETLGLKTGAGAYAFFKASAVILGRDLHGAKVSARNILCGTVTRIVRGPVNVEVSVALSGGSILTAIITKESARNLAFGEGDHACALVKASSVLIGVAG